MRLYIPAFVTSLLVITQDNTEIDLQQTTTDSGVTLLSIHGQFDDVQKFAEAQKWNTASIVADGDNATELKDDANQDDLQRQMIVIMADKTGKSFEDAQASITKSELAELKDENFAFGHFVAALNHGVNIMSWTEGYHGKWAKYATQSRLAFYIDTDTRTIRNSKTNELTVLFIGDEGTRTLLGQISGQNDVKVITSNFDASTKIRHDTTVDYLIEVKFGGDTVNAVSAENLAKYFNGRINDLAWAQTSVGNDIEEISTGIAGQNVVLLTLKDSEYRYVPATVAIEDGKLVVIPSTHYGVKVKDFGGAPIGAPIVRASKNGLVMVDRNGGNDVINFSGSKTMDHKSYGPAMKRMINAATDGLSATV